MKSSVQFYIDKIEADYQRVVVALQETIHLMAEVDSAISDLPVK